MIQDYLKAGYPAFVVLTQEPLRAELSLVSTEGWAYTVWDCLTGIKEAGTNRLIEEIRDPVEAIKWLNQNRDMVMIAHNMHLFMEIPEVIQAIQNGIHIWKGVGSALVIISPTILLRPELDKLFTIIDLPLPDDDILYNLQQDLCKSVNVNPNQRAAKAAKGLTEFEAETAFALSLIKKGYCQHPSDCGSEISNDSQIWPYGVLGTGKHSGRGRIESTQNVHCQQSESF